MTDGTPWRTGDRLAEVYGAAAALLRNDRGGAGILVAMLVDDDDLLDVLLTLASAALERLDRALTAAPEQGTHPSSRLARELLDLALETGFALPDSVHAAAWRLDAVRREDMALLAHSVSAFRPQLDDFDLVAGAVALLAALVTFGARCAGEAVLASAERLCVAVSLSAP